MREMKSSGTPWIGEVPTSWSLVRFKDKYQSVKEIAREKSGEFERLALTLNGVIKRPKDDSEGLQPKEFDTYQILRENDFVFKMIDLQNISTSRVGLSPYTGLVSPAYLRFSPKKEGQDNRFVYYYLMSLYYNCVFNNLGGNGVRSALNATDMGEFIIPFPSDVEQQQICNYLEKQNKKVDALIANVQTQIEKLKAYKQSMITEAVTKGLNANVPMKDSGINWIGLAPSHWDIIQAKYCININHGSDPKTEGNIPVYGSGAESFKTCGEYKEGPVVLVGRKGATLHIPHYIEGRYWNVDTAFDVTAHENCNIKFYYYLATAFDYKYYMSQTTLPGMTQFAYRNMYLPIPKLDEQEIIVRYLDQKCEQFNQLIAIKQSKIEKLEHYKKSIIYEYVTGKKEVQ